jgi:peptidoglycan/LPS O-acetylase OafA/YrhL
MVFPSTIPQEFRLLYLVILLLAATLMHFYKKRITRTALLLALVAALALVIYLANFTQIIEDHTRIYVGVAGVVFVFLGISLPITQSSLMRESAELVGWWWFAMAAGSAAALFWSTRLYFILGDGLLLIVGLLLMGIAGAFWWYGRSQAGNTGERGVVGGNPML